MALHAVKRLPKDEQGSAAEWEDRFRASLRPPDVINITHAEWRTGAPGWDARREGPMVVCVLDEARTEEVSGGERRFGLRATDDWELAGEWRVGSDSFRDGWQDEARRLRGLVEFDTKGMPVHPGSGAR